MKLRRKMRQYLLLNSTKLKTVWEEGLSKQKILINANCAQNLGVFSAKENNP
jgi:hypothetical protein